MIRKAEAKDAGRMAEIQICGWRNAYRGIVSDRILFSRLNIEKKSVAIRKEIEGTEDLWYVFEEEGIVKGMMAFGGSRDEDKKDSFELWCIYVEPLFKRQGVGATMLRFCEEEARGRGFDEVMLWVFEKNAPGRSFYERNGYRADGKTQEIPALDAIEMRYGKRLSLSSPEPSRRES